MAVAMDTAVGIAPPINYEEYVLSLTLATGAESFLQNSAREGSFVVGFFLAVISQRWYSRQVGSAALDVLCFKG